MEADPAEKGFGSERMTRVAGRTKWIAGLAVLLIGISVYLSFWHGKIDLKIPLLDGSTITVVPGVHLIGGLGPAAAYVVETQEGLVLIDTGLESDAQALKSELGTLGLEWTKLRAILLTHVHGDHCGGAERLRAETGAIIYAGAADAPMLIAGGPREAFFSTFKMPGHSPHPTTVDVPLQGNETITIGGARFQTLGTPGHTAGSTCYLMEWAGLRILFSGDVVYRLGDTPLGTYSTYLAPRYGGNAVTYLASLRMLQELRVPDLVLPGHPRASRVPQSPRLTEQDWDEMFDRGIREMERLVNRFKTDGANFLDGRPKQLLTDLYYLGDFHGAAVYGLLFESQLYVVDAPRPGLNEFLKKQLKELDVKSTEPSAVLLTACGENETAGLKELVERTGARVIAGADGIDAVRKVCPPGTTITSAEELAKDGSFAMTVVPLGGPGRATVSYLFHRAGKTILISGRLPNVFEQKPQEDRLSDALTLKPIAVEAINSIRRLTRINPDLWLPGVPTDAQNANLYEGAWNGILEKSFRAANDRLQGR